MKTIQEIALGTIFPKEQINTILEIVNATQNPQVAVELLLGIYEQPYIAKYVEHPDKGTLSLIEYDKFRDKVYYTYIRKKKVGIYVDKTADESLINADNYKEYEKPYNRDTVKHISVTLDTDEWQSDECYYDTWAKYPEMYSMDA